jgi:ketosteroid isomerase-like protein
MTRFVATVAVALLGSVVFAADPKDDVKLVLNEQMTAWNKGDIDGYMKGYWQSDDLTFYSGGTTTKGWKNTLERYKKNYTVAGKKMGKLDFADVEVTMLADDSAYVLGKWKLTGLEEPAGGLFTLIVKKKPEGWRIVHDHTSK